MTGRLPFGDAGRLKGERVPAVIEVGLKRGVVGLVRHFGGFPDPVAEIDVRQAAAPRFLHLPQHGINPEPARFLVRIVKVYTADRLSGR